MGLDSLHSNSNVQIIQPPCKASNARHSKFSHHTGVLIRNTISPAVSRQSVPQLLHGPILVPRLRHINVLISCCLPCLLLQLCIWVLFSFIASCRCVLVVLPYLFPFLLVLVDRDILEIQQTSIARPAVSLGSFLAISDGGAVLSVASCLAVEAGTGFGGLVLDRFVGYCFWDDIFEELQVVFGSDCVG